MYVQAHFPFKKRIDRLQKHGSCLYSCVILAINVWYNNECGAFKERIYYTYMYIYIPNCVHAFYCRIVKLSFTLFKNDYIIMHFHAISTLTKMNEENDYEKPLASSL